MMTFGDIQTQVNRRFKSSLSSDVKTWIRDFYAAVWEMDDWTFKQASTLVTVTSGLQTVSALPDDLGQPRLLQDQYGDPVVFLETREFERRYYDSTQVSPGTPYHFTVIGDFPNQTVKVGPASDVTSNAFQLLYDRAPGHYPSTTLNAATVTLPAATLTVVSTAEFPSSGTALVGGRKVSYTGKTPTTLTGCTGGTGSFTTGDLVVSLAPVAGQLVAASDVPLLPPDTHMVFVYGAQGMGTTLEADITGTLSDDRVAQLLDGMRRRYLTSERGADNDQYGSATDDYAFYGGR
jgi:hypothetical protein